MSIPPRPKEDWVSHPRYKVECSSLGRLKYFVNQTQKRFITYGCKQRRNGTTESYEWVTNVLDRTTNKRGTRRVHHLILEAFGYERTQERPMVDHINHNSLDNRLSNLRWCNAFENNNNKRIKL